MASIAGLSLGSPRHCGLRLLRNRPAAVERRLRSTAAFATFAFLYEFSGAQTAYAQLIEATLGAEHSRSVADLSGSFNAKTVKGHKYWYFQYTEPGSRLMQVYVGPDGEPIHRLMARKANPGVQAALGPMARSALALGCAGMVPRQFRVVRRLADYGFFQAGGVLIGPHAFLAYGNMLGLRWGAQDRTHDIDFAHAGKALALVLPGAIEVKTGDAIESLNMGFLRYRA